MTHDPPCAWRKSSYSDADGNCVEVAPDRLAVRVRDSKSPDGPSLALSREGFAGLVAEIRDGRLDRP